VQLTVISKARLIATTVTAVTMLPSIPTADKCCNDSNAERPVGENPVTDRLIRLATRVLERIRPFTGDRSLFLSVIRTLYESYKQSKYHLRGSYSVVVQTGRLNVLGVYDQTLRRCRLRMKQMQTVKLLPSQTVSRRIAAASYLK
jgi:hypothetical protein